MRLTRLWLVLGMLFVVSLAFGQNILMSESFEGTFPEWVLVSGSSATWTQTTTGAHPTTTPEDGTYFAMFNSWTCSSGAEARIQLPAFNFASQGVQNAQFSYWMYHDSGYTSYTSEGVQIQVSTDGGTTWTAVGSFNPRYDGTVGWANAIVDLSAYQTMDNVRVGILGHSQYGNDCYVDNCAITGLGAHGTISGTVTVNGGAGVVTNVVVQAGDFTTNPAADGTYSLTVDPGTYTVTANLLGYTTTAYTGVVVADGDNLTGYNFTLQPSPMVNVYGVVHNTDDVAVQGATVTLAGIETYNATTAADGSFSFAGVWISHTYDLTIEKEGYDTVEQTVTVGTTDVNLGTITLPEHTNPVNGLRASVVADDVTLTWNHPTDIAFFDFEADNGGFTSDDASGWQWGTDTDLGEYSGTNCWGTVLNGDYGVSCSYKLTSPAIAVNSDNFLTFYHYMLCENGWDGGNVKISTDNGATWTLITPDGGYPSTSITGLGEPGYTDDTGGYVQASFDLSAYAGQTVMFQWHFGSDSSVVYTGWAIDDVRVGPAETRGRELARVVSPMTARPLTAYRIYRDGAQIAQIDTTAMTYTDSSLPDGDYTYGVQAIYGSNYSEIKTVDCQVYPINITGYVVTSDATGTGVTGATVTVQNDEYYFETTTTNGNFSLLNINGMQTYDIEIAKDGYQSWNPEVNPIAVTDQDIVYGTVANPVILPEMMNPPLNVVATESGDGNSVTVTWNSPGNGQTGWIQWCADENSDSIGTGGAAEFVYAARWTGDDLADFAGMPLSKVDFWPAVDCTYEVRVYTGGSGDVAGGVYSEGTMVTSQAVDAVTIGAWNEIVLDSPVSVPSSQELWIGIYVNTSSGYPAGCDAGPEVPGFGNLMYWEGTWAQLTDLGTLPYNWNIKGWVGAARGGYVAMQHHNSNVVPFANRANAPRNEGTLSHAGYSLAQDQNVAQVRDNSRHVVNTTDTRALTNYKIYRLIAGNEGNEATWVLLNTQAATDSDYVDTAYGALDPDQYRYAVKAVYTGTGNESTATFSNILAHNMYCHVTLNVSTNSGDAPTGAVVTLTNQDGDAEHVYVLTIPANGTVVHDVWKGVYHVTGSLNFFADYDQDNVVLSEDTATLTVQLTELLNTVYDLAGTQTAPGQATLTWISPYDAGDEFTEGFEGGDTPDGWTIVQTSTDDSHPTSTWWSVTDYSNSSFDPALVPPEGSYHAGLWWGYDPQDEWLITPEFQCGPNTQFSFTSYVYYGSSNGDDYYIKVSTDGGSTWNILWDATALSPEGWNGYGDPYVVSLGDYVGQQVEVAFHALGPSGLYAVWFVDEVTVASNGRVLHFTNNDMTRKGESHRIMQDQRNLLGYLIARDGVTIEEQYTGGTTYVDNGPNNQGLASGTYNYTVKAVYTTGTSPAMSVQVVSTGDQGQLPAVTTLKGNFPNPFNPTTTISYSLAKETQVTIDVYNMRGQKVTTLVNDKQTAGTHTVVWNGTNSNGQTVASGVYFYKMQSGTYTSTKKMIMLK